MMDTLERILNRMEPGVCYTAAELAVESRFSRNIVGQQLRKAVADGRVEIIGHAVTGWRSGTGYVYRIKEEE